MKIVWAILSVAALLLVAVSINSIGDDSPVISANGDAPAADGNLAGLGPVELITAGYLVTEGISCNVPQSSCAGNLQNVVEGTGFEINSDVTITSCVGVNNFTISFATSQAADCAIQGNDIHMDVDVTHNPAPNPPCDGTIFANVVLENSITNDTLTVQVQRTSSGVGACST